MPPTFLYLVALILWVGFGVAVWVVAAILMIFPGMRRTGRRLACAMAVTFPGVIVYQALAAPVVAALLLTMWLFWKTLEPGPGTTTSNPAVIAISLLTLVLAFIIVLAMSLAGFWEGWRVGWAMGAGQGFMSTARTGPLFRVVRHVRSRLFASGAN